MGSGIQGRLLRDNDGKVLFPAGMATTSKDPPHRVQPKGARGSRIGGWGHSSDEEGVMPFYMRINRISRKVTP